MRRLFSLAPVPLRRLTLGDALVLLALAGLLYIGARLAVNAPPVVRGPTISLDPEALPWYAVLSTGRMALAYLLSMVFAFVYGRAAARSPRAERTLLPLLDVLQSVPILSFLPVVLLSLSVILPQRAAAELAAIVLIFTSQAWNLVFSVYQSAKTVPGELREAAAVFRFGPWLRLKYLEGPFAAISLIWNSIMSWAGGWFFLMAAEMFSVGNRDFRLPGLGSYLQTAANAGDIHAVLLGVAMLVSVIVLIDQLLWRPLLTWADRFKLDTLEGTPPPQAWFHAVLARSWLLGRFVARVLNPGMAWLDRRLQHPVAPVSAPLESSPSAPLSGARRVLLFAGAALLAWLGYRAALMLATLPVTAWLDIGAGLAATTARVALALLIALAWTLPIGVLIGLRPAAARVLQPLAQIAASVPATALFPIMLLALLQLPGGLDLSAVLLMLLGTQWYLLFNVIAGATAIPTELRDTTALLGLNRRERWRVLILPALFPYIITGAITASGGAWNASIVAEYVRFGGVTHHTLGIGAQIAAATAAGDYPRLLAATLSMVLLVALINRLFWQRLYALAERRYRLE